MSKESKIKQQIAELLETDDHWKITVNGKKLLSPYDGNVMAIISKNKDETIDTVYKHLVFESDTWNEFTGEYISLEELRKKAFLQELKANLRQSPEFQIKDKNGNWFCPYSAKFSNISLLDDEPLTQTKILEIYDFIISQPEYVKNDKKPKSLSYLKTKISYMIHPSFRFRSANGKWVNPYDGQETSIDIPENFKPTEKMWFVIYDFLKNNPSYNHGKGKVLPASSFRSKVPKTQALTSISGLIKEKFINDYTWHQFTPHNTWECPFCGMSVGNIKPSTDNEVVLNLNSKAISRHLLFVCHVFKSKLASAKFETEEDYLRLLDSHEKKAETAIPVNVQNPMQFSEPYSDSSEALPVFSPNNGQNANNSNRQSNVHTQEVSLDPISLKKQSTDVSALKYSEMTPEQKAQSQLISHVNSQLTSIMSDKDFNRGQDEHKRMLEELREKQMRILPEPPDIDGIDISVIYQPCNVVGGDFYDFIRIKNNEQKLGIVQADVSGHGAEVFGDVTMTMKTLRIYAKQTTSPNEMLINANEDLVPDLTSKTFVSIFYSILDIETFELVMARAGHNPLLLYNPEREEPFNVIEPQGMVVGMVAGTMFDNSLKEETLQLYSGDMLVYYTDGVTETMDAEGEEYGFERLRNCIIKNSVKEADEVNREIMKELEEFRRGSLADDDITLIAIKVL